MRDDVFRFVEPVFANRAAFGHQIRQLLALACMEVEAQCRAVLRANNYRRLTKKQKLVAEKHWKVDDFMQLDQVLYLSSRRVELIGYAWPARQPFAPWAEPKQDDQALPWYQAYNATKHDRELQFAMANMENLIDALAASVLLIYAQFGRWGRTSFGGSEPDGFEVYDPVIPLGACYVPPEFLGTGSAWTAKSFFDP